MCRDLKNEEKLGVLVGFGVRNNRQFNSAGCRQVRLALVGSLKWLNEKVGLQKTRFSLSGLV